VIGTGHACFAAKLLYPAYYAFIVGGDDNPPPSFSKFCSFKNPLDHGLARESDKRLTGQAGGTVPRWNYYDHLAPIHFETPRLRAPGKSGRTGGMLSRRLVRTDRAERTLDSRFL